MKLTNKSLKLAGAFALAMTAVLPIALATAADAAPVKVVTKPSGAVQIVAKPGSTITTNQNGVIKVAVNHFRYGYDDRTYDYRHKPPARFEHRPSFARFFHAGHWDFRFGHWMWVGGYWTRWGTEAVTVHRAERRIVQEPRRVRPPGFLLCAMREPEEA